MGETTRISWTDSTFNPWWGCEHVSPGCHNCYAETFAKRTGHDVWGHGGARRFFGEKHWSEPLKWARNAAVSGRRHLVFCASMCDVFEPRRDLDEERARLFTLIADTPALTWQLLTKRPEQVLQLVPTSWLLRWPRNVWVGTTCEDQQRAELRIPRLLKIAAPVRFLSCEPLLEPLDLRVWLSAERAQRVEWVIVGGESGAHFRPMDPRWALSLRDQCWVSDVPFFFKQHGGLYPGGDDRLYGELYKQFPS